MMCESMSHSGMVRQDPETESDPTSRESEAAPQTAMTVGMTMVLPSSHSPAVQDQAMGAALSERQLGLDSREAG